MNGENAAQNAGVSEWPQWVNKDTFKTRRFTFHSQISDFTVESSITKLALLKSKEMLDFYKKKLKQNEIRNVLELGTFKGGMPFYLIDTLLISKIVSLDFHQPSDTLLTLVENFNLCSSLIFKGGIDQRDGEACRAAVDGEFNEPLDLIIDDCSHYYKATKTSFENLFGYLKPGGLYFIEDWGWTHWDGVWQTEDSHFHGMPSLTNLIFEIVAASSSVPNIISDIHFSASTSIAVITRGPDLPYKNRLDLSSSIKLAGRKFSGIN